MRAALVISTVSTLLASTSLAAAQGVTLVDPSKRHTPRNQVTRVDGEAPAPVKRRPGEVLFNLRQADLTSEVLPLIERQAGVKVRYSGPPKTVDLRLVRPLDWEAALELIGKFTGTHLATDYQGRFVLKPKNGGELPEVGTFDDLDGQLARPAHLRRRERSVAASAPRPAPRVAPRRKLPVIVIGNTRGAFSFGGNNRPRVSRKRVGPRRVGPRRVGPRRRVKPRRTGPRRRVGPRRVGPRRPQPAL